MSSEITFPESLVDNLDVNTPLLVAIQSLDGMTVARFLQGDYTIDESEATRALLLAVKLQHASVLQQLLTCAQVRTHQSHAVLLQAVLLDAAICVSVLLGHRPSDADEHDGGGWSALLLAAACGHHRSAAVLLQAGAASECRDLQGNTPLLVAARRGCELTVELLMTRATLTARNNTWRVALHEAALGNHENVLGALLRANVDVSARDCMGQTALALAAKHGCARALATLASWPNAGLNATDVISMTPLHWAVLGGHTACVHVLLGARARTRTCNVGTGNTALMHAAELGHTGIVRLLLRARCNANATNCQKRAALHVAAERGHVDVITQLLDAGAAKDARTANGDTALIIAVRFQCAHAIAALVAAGCDTRLANGDGMTALHEAAMIGSTASVRLLLKAGTPPALLEGDGDTPLMLAAARGHADAVAALLVTDASRPDSPNQLQRSALMQAAAQGHVDVVALLLAAGVDADLHDVEGDSALLLAASKGHVAVIACLLRAGCDMAHTNTWGRNALHEAAAAWHADVATTRLLLRAPRLPRDDADHMHTTPLILAVLGGRPAIVGALLAANCDADRPGMWPDERRVTPLQLAVSNDALLTARLLRLAGARLGPVTSPLAPRMLHWLRQEAAATQPLKLICRTRIRQALRPADVAAKVDTLMLPTALKQYVLIDDLSDAELLEAASGESRYDSPQQL